MEMMLSAALCSQLWNALGHGMLSVVESVVDCSRSWKITWIVQDGCSAIAATLHQNPKDPKMIFRRLPGSTRVRELDEGVAGKVEK